MNECIKRVTYLFLISMIYFTISLDSYVMASMSRELNDFSYVIESFERGDLNQTNYIAGAGKITSDPQQIITGKYSVYVESSPKEEWKDAIYSNSNKIHFEKNTTYAVTFSYKNVAEAVADNNGYFYFTARGVGSDYRSDKGWTEWTGQAGKTGTKTITFKTGDEGNYFLIWGIHNGGALSLDDISVQKLSESFERGDLNQTNYVAGAGRITSDPQQIITGKHSVYVESSPKEEWKDAIYTNVHIERNTTYAVTFSYKSIVEPVQVNNGYFYFTARGVGSDYKSDKGWTEWTGQAGKMGTKTITFKTGEEENYFLIWGIHNGGSLSLDDISIQKLSESFERGDLNQTNYIAGAGRITSDPQQIITGKHSVYVESSPKEEWKDAIYTNANKVHFEKNTTYAVTFSYKSIVEPVQGKNGYFYFTARGVGSGDISDKGWTEWTGQSGKSGTKTITFKTGDEENYFLIWGIHNGGALSLDDIMIKKDEYQYDANGRLGRVYLPGNVEIKYFYDANGNLMRRERSN
ncbi:RHS repeat protein [Paenibacillus sp. UNC217MF]|nr:RHS repeat protein [Paenibacillus sp. UNC217MF]